MAKIKDQLGVKSVKEQEAAVEQLIAIASNQIFVISLAIDHQGRVILPSKPDAPREAIVYMLTHALDYFKELGIREKLAQEGATEMPPVVGDDFELEQDVEEDENDS